MSAPYRHEIRLGGEIAAEIRELGEDVAEEFGVRTTAREQSDPHVPLFGPFDTDEQQAVKRRTQAVLDGHEVVPFRIEGFGRFGTDVLYADVVPSPALHDLRRELTQQLRPVTHNFRPRDTEVYYEFHVPIATGVAGDQFDRLREHVEEHHDLRSDEYALRVSAVRGSDMLWEWDLPRGIELRPTEATARASWLQTERALEPLADGADHEFDPPEPGVLERLWYSLG